MTEPPRIARRTLLGWLAGAFGAVAAGCSRRSEETEEPVVLSDRELLRIVADVLLPGDGELPAASAVQIVDRFRTYLSTRPMLARRHATDWPVLRAGLEPGAPEHVAATVAVWYEELRSSPAPSPEAERFEALRRDLLRVYYADLRVQHLLGYDGPAVVHGV